MRLKAYKRATNYYYYHYAKLSLTVVAGGKVGGKPKGTALHAQYRTALIARVVKNILDAISFLLQVFVTLMQYWLRCRCRKM